MNTNLLEKLISVLAAPLCGPAGAGRRFARPEVDALARMRRQGCRRSQAAVAFYLTAALVARAGVAPTISNVTAAQTPGTKDVVIQYTLTDPDSTAVSISIAIFNDVGTTSSIPAVSFTGDYGGSITPGNNKTVTWNAGADWDGQFTDKCRVQITANDADPEGFVFIFTPSGTPFQMGDPFGEGLSRELPVHPVSVSAFYIEKTLVTGARWAAVSNYARLHNYTFLRGAEYKAPEHPVHSVTWWNAVKWCNARSQMDGRTPVYYENYGFTTIYRTGEVEPFVNWGANGYRLPTEAEWEKAVRGGLSGKRFPWGDTITTNQANYSGSTDAYNLSGAFGYHPAYYDGTQPYTSPVASFAPNGYGLFDMAGNVYEWCWDWYQDDYYSVSPCCDPRGPSTPQIVRVLRGGSWYNLAAAARCANRESTNPDAVGNAIGFRCVRGL